MGKIQVRFTSHILNESYLRIGSRDVKKDEKETKRYLKNMFCDMWATGWYKGEKAIMTHNNSQDEKRNQCFKIGTKKHKLVVRKIEEDIFLIITYMKKRKIDEIEYKVLQSIRNQTGKKK